MADSKLLILGAAGVAVWYFYFRTPAPAAVVPITGGGSTGGGGTPAGGTSTGTGSSTSTGTGSGSGSPPAANTVAGIYAKMVTASGLGPTDTLGVDGWGYYLNQILAPMGLVAPDPLSVFGASAIGADRSVGFTPANYWAVMGPAVKSLTGLSGLGFFGGGRW
jgi:hypothetical protein